LAEAETGPELKPAVIACRMHNAMSYDPFLTQLSDLCRSERTRAKWVFVSSHDVGLALGDRLVLEGCDWVNLRFVTPLGMALDTAAPFLVEQGLDPLPDGLGPSLAMRLLLMDLPSGTPSYFSTLADQPRMGSALWAAIRELRMANVRAAHLPAAAFEDKAKHAELQALLAAYESYLSANRQADAADVYRAAALHADRASVAEGDLLIEAPGLWLPPVARAFVDALPGTRVHAACAEVPGLVVPRRWRTQTFSAAQGPPHNTERVGVLAFLLEPAKAPADAGGPNIEMFHAAGREAEVEAVLRRILAHETTSGGSAAAGANPATLDVPAGRPTPDGPSRRLPTGTRGRAKVGGRALDQVEIACASSAYAYLVWEKAQRLELPVTAEHGIPITITRPARALLAFCDWIDSGLVAGRLRRLLQGGDVRVVVRAGGDLRPAGETDALSGQADEAGDDQKIGGPAAARLLLKSEASWGRETYDRSLAALAARYRAHAADTEDLDEDERAEAGRKADHAERLRGWVHTLLTRVPLADERGDVSLVELVNGLSAFLEDGVSVAGPLDVAAVTVMRQALGDLLALHDLRRPMRQALALVREAVASLSVGASRARPGHLHVSSLQSAGYAGRPFTFIVGLQEGGVFPSLVEDPVLLDVERHAISGALATSHDRLEEAVHAVLSRLAVLPDAATCFSCSCRDLVEGRETFPSWLMLQVLRLKQANANLAYEHLRQQLGTPETLVPPAPADAISESGWWLAAVKSAAGAASAEVLDAFPSLAAGRKAVEARESDRFTEWDGFVRAARAALDPRVSGQPVSVTRIEGLVSCPFRYFVEHGLGVEVIEDDDPDFDEWLDPLMRGAALHEVYATLGRGARARGARLDPRRDGDHARQVADAKLQELRVECPPPSDVVFDRERADFLRDVDLFLDFEFRRADSVPVAFEVSFGRGPDEEEPLAQAGPVTIALGQGQAFQLRGTIDRIDRLPDGSYEVIDYKTGRYDRTKYNGVFGGGAVLQHALYGVAAAALLRKLEKKPRVARGVYEFPSAKGGGERIPIDPPKPGALVEVLSDLFDVIAQGAFVPADDNDACRFCDFTRACRMPVEQAKAKLENAKNTRLAAYLKLRSHE
jgi:hypothetical protein